MLVMRHNKDTSFLYQIRIETSVALDNNSIWLMWYCENSANLSHCYPDEMERFLKATDSKRLLFKVRKSIHSRGSKREDGKT